MIGETRILGHGREASEALARSIEAAKTHSPLAPVTVVVTSNFAALAARHLLGSGRVGAGVGIVNVSFVTPVELATLLATGQLADSHPLTNPVLGAAVRRVLAAETGPLRRVAAHVATETALAALYAELSRISDEARARLTAAGGRAGEAVRIHAAVQAELDGFHAETDVADAAAGRADLETALASFGHVIWYLPEPLPPALRRLVTRVIEVAPSTVLVALTGVPEADFAVLETCRAAGVAVPEDAGTGIEVVVAPHVISVTDADEEVRAVVRRIATLAEAGTRLDRMGIFFPRPDPYVRIVRRQLVAAGFPSHGPSPERLADSAAGRTLLAALALPHQRWRRDRVMALVSGAPVRNGDAKTRPATWEDLSRRAGVVRGLDDWRRKLDAHVQRIDAELTVSASAQEDPDVNRERWQTRLEREKADAEALGRVVEDLAAAVARVEMARGWYEKA
ncbi:MAG: hypothetical protein IT198_15385, partial [Acidimicrobiia bacterium]|nr:hypothetical protein [Acidimicrobiia bacterium]